LRRRNLEEEVGDGGRVFGPVVELLADASIISSFFSLMLLRVVDDNSAFCGLVEILL
jgi:hypothetical protein